MTEFMNSLSSSKAFRLAAIAVLVLLAIFLLVSAWKTAFSRSPNQPFNTITVEGTGDAVAIPDLAKITFTVTESAANVADAQKATTDKTDAALAALESQGVKKEDTKTTNYNVSPKYQYPQPCYSGICPVMVSGTPKIVGYEVSQSVEVKVRDTGKAGAVLESLGGLNVQNISGPDFTVDDDSKVKDEARSKAIEDAQTKARALAKELGVHLGDVVSFSENTGGAYPMYNQAYGGTMMDAKTSVAPTLPVGQNETNMTVSVTYEIR
ncbi:MAG: hypothetical protein JWN64_496 [Parcubacteria group bacterium]|nr:hypothetical protein [Parcubacteria group bacterium]